MRLSILLIPFLLFSCTHHENKKKYLIDPLAKKLNDSALSLATYSNEYEKAVYLLDQATEIDSNYFEAYKNKLSFLGLMPKVDIDKALVAIKNLSRLRPDDPEYIMLIGLFYLKKGDSTIATNFLTNAANKYDKILDTMNRSSASYEFLLSYKAYNLILLGKEQEGHEIFKKLYSDTQDSLFKEYLIQTMNRTRQNILDSLPIQ